MVLDCLFLRVVSAYACDLNGSQTEFVASRSRIERLCLDSYETQ